MKKFLRRSRATSCRRTSNCRQFGIRFRFRFPTPGWRTIADLARTPYLVPASNQIKTLVFVATINGEQRRVLALLRGNHQLHEVKFGDAIGATAVRVAHPEEIRELLGASAGSLGGGRAEEAARAAKQDLMIVADQGLK